MKLKKQPESRGYYDLEPLSQIEQESLLDKMLEKLLASEAAVKINEGNKGIILEVDTSGLADEVREYFSADTETDGSKEEDKVAVKLFKIYTGTEGRHEYEMQKKAHQVLAEEKVEGVSVPRPRSFRELKIENDEIAEHLKSFGLKIGSEREVEVLSMDLIKGRDVATLMYEAYVRKNESDFKRAYPDLTLEEYLKQLDLDGLINLFHRLAGLKPKYGNYDDSPEAINEKNKNSKILLEEVSYQGLLTKKQVKAIKKAFEALHQHGLYHRDPHPRNIMIDENGEVVIVDFGSAKEIDPNNSLELKSVYRVKGEPDRSYLQDESIISLADKLAKTEADKYQEIQKTNYLGDPKSLREKLAAKKLKIWQEFISAINQEEDISRLIKLYEAKLGSVSDFKLQIALLSEMAEQGKKAEVVKYLKSTIEAESQKKRHSRSDLLINSYQALLDWLA